MSYTYTWQKILNIRRQKWDIINTLKGKILNYSWSMEKWWRNGASSSHIHGGPYYKFNE